MVGPQGVERPTHAVACAISSAPSAQRATDAAQPGRSVSAVEHVTGLTRRQPDDRRRTARDASRAQAVQLPHSQRATAFRRCGSPRDELHDVLRYLKHEVTQPYRMLYDLTAIDERVRSHREGQPASDFTVVYHLLSFDRNDDVRVKVALDGERPSLPTITDLWPAANWYEREVWDMFGIDFDGHPHLRRILMPPTWEGHPLRKEHPARATEMDPFQLPTQRQDSRAGGAALPARRVGHEAQPATTPTSCS